jgi:hypothetical protein
MALDFFRVERGLELDDLVQYLQGSGIPGIAGDTANAPVGSVYTNNNDGSLFTKIAAGSGTDKWQKMASETYVNNAVGATISWREPVVVRNNVATSLPSATATQPITIDGVSIANGQRVLFSAIVGAGGKNIYIYDQNSGTFTEDSNAESNGDAVYVVSGTSAGKTFVFNGADWVQSDQSSLDEEGFIRAFIGKDTAGNTLPSYTSTNFVTQNSSLSSAVSALDTELGANVALGNFVDPAFKINANIQALDTAIGANVTNGGFIVAGNSVNQNIQVIDTHLGVNFAAGNYISLNQTVSGAVTALDVAIGPNVVDGNFVLSSNKVQQNIQAIDSEIGANVSAGGYVSSSNTINQNIQALDTALTEVTKEVSVTNVTSVQTIDTIVAGAAKWFVRVELVSDTSRVYATEVYALNDGGLNSDFTRYATLKLGTAIPGLVVSVDNDGATSGQLRLRVAATGAVNVVARRASVL